MLILMNSCSADLNTDNSENTEEIEQQYIFQYSIIIKDDINRDLLDSETIGYYYEGNEYNDGFLKIIFPSNENVKEQSYSIKKYNKEWRIVINFEFDNGEIKSQLETILELCVLLPGCGQDGIYTNDAISCDVCIENKSVVCNSIKVNGQIEWEKENVSEEPFIILEKLPCDYAIVCL